MNFSSQYLHFINSLDPQQQQHVENANMISATVINGQQTI